MSELETARLRLRRWRDDDLDAYALICADPEVMRYLSGGRPLTRAQSREQMRGFMEHWDRHGFGPWAVDHQADDRFLGFVGLSIRLRVWVHAITRNQWETRRAGG